MVGVFSYTVIRTCLIYLSCGMVCLLILFIIKNNNNICYYYFCTFFIAILHKVVNATSSYIIDVWRRMISRCVHDLMNRSTKPLPKSLCFVKLNFSKKPSRPSCCGNVGALPAAVGGFPEVTKALLVIGSFHFISLRSSEGRHGLRLHRQKLHMLSVDWSPCAAGGIEP